MGLGKFHNIIIWFLWLILIIPKVSLAQSSKAYKGLGILPLAKGDIVEILPDTAFLINLSIYNTGLEAVDYVKNDKCSLLLQKGAELDSIQQKRIKQLELELKGMTTDYYSLINSSSDRIKELEEARINQRYILDELKYNVSTQKAILQEQKRKIRRRNITIIGVVIVGTITTLYL